MSNIEVCFTTSFKGNAIYRRAMKAFAAQQGKTIGDLTRDAFDKVYGDSIQPYISFFVTQNGNSNEQSDIQDDKGLVHE